MRILISRPSGTAADAKDPPRSLSHHQANITAPSRCNPDPLSACFTRHHDVGHMHHVGYTEVPSNWGKPLAEQ
jgi:hypothetical protein